MMRWRRTTACERAAQWISLDLDDELGSLDRAALAKHLERCPGCRALSAEIGGFTRLLRIQPLETPPPATAVQVARPRARATRRLVAVALAAATAVAVGVTLLPGANRSSVSSLGFRNVDEQQRYAREHTLVEPTVFAGDFASPPWYARRALL